MSVRSSHSPNQDLLQAASTTLGLVDGCLLPASLVPRQENREAWVDKGDWLALAATLDAKSVFFVENEPLVVLAELPANEDEARFFNRIWCMARPQLLFLARAGELAIYQLTKPPIRKDEAIENNNRLLGLARSVAEIQQNLSNFHREALESGEIFGDERFEAGAFRADRALVHDLKTVRRLLTESESDSRPQLTSEVAHALIGRALFVRYLEDRGILSEDYFRAIAARKHRWLVILDTPPTQVFAEPEFANKLFFRVLQDRDFCYAFFEQLAIDFNGDTFPVTSVERRDVQSIHLTLLRSLLIGERIDGQLDLFLFAYKFDVIPIELISSIYEDFYTAHKGKGKTQASYYTPPALVDFLLSQVLIEECLDKRPRLLDPACGSGIFLVEAFRRMVRHRVRKQGRRLSQRELRTILRDQIAGIDLNSEAIPVAAFSLYLAYLHYQNPREINENRILPNLKWNSQRADRDVNQHLDILFAGNAFAAINHSDPQVRLRFGATSADLVVGNPPWGEVKPNDVLGKEALPTTLAWCNESPVRIIGEQEMSQAFVHLALELLVDGGTAALLLSSGVLFKQHEYSRQFRRSWLQRCKIKHIVNFAHVRHLHFSDPIRRAHGSAGIRESDGTSPFISAIFEKGSPSPGHRFKYWAARRTADVEKTRAIVINHSDMHHLTQEECVRRDELWKLYWWGGRRDEGLIRELERFPNLLSVMKERNAQFPPYQGYTPGKVWESPKWLGGFTALDTKSMVRYGTSARLQFENAPATVEYRPESQEPFRGPRLLVRQGISQKDPRYIVSRYESDPFCFTKRINCFRLDGLTEEERLIITGIYWSSLSTYYFWLTAGSWGMWHDELHLHSASRLPITFPKDLSLRKRITRIVTKLRNLNDSESPEDVNKLENELDDCVFTLYEFNESDCDLVREMNQYGLDFFYRRGKSRAVASVIMPDRVNGLLCDLPSERAGGLTGYLQAFLRQWNADLAPEGELAWEVIPATHTTSVLAVTFSTVGMRERPPSTHKAATNAWEQVLARFDSHSLLPLDRRRSIFTDTFVRAVGEHEILIIKRNEARLWTRSMARADADATIAQAMNLADAKA